MVAIGDKPPGKVIKKTNSRFFRNPIIIIPDLFEKMMGDPLNPKEGSPGWDDPCGGT